MSGPRQLGFWEEPEADGVLCGLWLAHVMGYASSHTGAVLDAFGSARAAWEQRDTAGFARLAGPAAARRAREPGCDPEQFRPLAELCEELGVQILCWDSPDYPAALADIPDRPAVLYAMGQLSCLNAPALLGMVGTRRPSGYGLDIAGRWGKDLAGKGAVIVSGLADGLDSASHRAALSAGGDTVAVLGVSIERTYPAFNASLRGEIQHHGCVLSEYAPGTSPGKNGFLQRNRLIAALSGALLVIEARERSGTMSTVGHARRYGRPVFAVPGSVFAPDSTGTNRLIQDGRAKMALGPEDLYKALGLESPAAPAGKQPPPAVSGPEKKLLGLLGGAPRSAEELAAASGLETAELLALLMRLQLAGRVTVLPGQRYILR